MLTINLNVSICEKTGKPVVAYLRVCEGKAAETREIISGKIYADYDINGQLLGVEFLY